jgi:GNAT superfamily N-acetyltransferase
MCSIYKSLTQIVLKSHPFWCKKLKLSIFNNYVKQLKRFTFIAIFKKMNYQFKIIPNDNLEQIIPLVFALNEERISEELLKLRFNEMKHQNYKCAVIYDANDNLVGVTGLWFCTRHYIGKSVELDHVYIKPELRGKGLGKKFMEWINNYAKAKGCNAIELNTYVENYPSHKFYNNEGFKALGYHFLKKF